MPKTKPTAVGKKYNGLATIYDTIYWHYTRKTIGIALSKTQFNNPQKILDIGCGTGALISELLKKNTQVNILGLDISDAMLEIARAKFEGHPQVTLKTGDFQEMEIPSNHFDWAFSLSNFHYFQNPQQTCLKAFASLKPGGKFLILDWIKEGVRPHIYQWYLPKIDKSFVRIYNFSELSYLLKNTGFGQTTKDIFNVFPFWHMMCVVAKKP